MSDRTYESAARRYLDVLCGVKPNRRTGSPGNREATDFFARTIRPWGYEIDAAPFPCLDWERAGTSLTRGGKSFDVRVSPYSLGCDVTAVLKAVSTVEELERCDCGGEILLMKGGICAEQLMPKNFVFYNPDHHKRVYALLEAKRPAALITATGRNPALVGGLHPYPLICDGDFDIPSVFCTEAVGEEIGRGAGGTARLKIDARRIPATACNVIARKNADAERKIVVSAHVDAYEDAPGASDDASGIAVELLLAEMLVGYRGGMGIEIVAFNGEDHYSAGGQIDYLRRFGGEFEKIAVAVNIDDVGYIRGRTAYSFFECPDEILQKACAAFGASAEMVKGEPWYQGDHMIFVQAGRPAIALTSENMAELMRDITHTSRDVPDIVDCAKLVEVARALERFVTRL